jgi:hypothetical protein
MPEVAGVHYGWVSEDDLEFIGHTLDDCGSYRKQEAGSRDNRGGIVVRRIREFNRVPG